MKARRSAIVSSLIVAFVLLPFLGGCRRFWQEVTEAVAVGVLVEGAQSAARQAQDRQAVNESRRGRLPKEGYVWATSDPNDLRTRWVPGRPHSWKPQKAGKWPGEWISEQGGVYAPPPFNPD